MAKAKAEPRYAHLQTLLLWEGALSNARLRELFGLSSVRASEWIREYRELHASWMRWDSVTRSYRATAKAYQQAESRDKLDAGYSLSRYLTLAGLPPAGTAEAPGRVIWGGFPDLATPRPHIFAALTDAARARRAVRIIYRSMRKPKPHERVIAPHSLVRAGRRWHTRAFCMTNQDFRDYALARIVEAHPMSEEASSGVREDEAWGTLVPVKLVPHPDLTLTQAGLIRYEYFSDAEYRVEKCRGALVSYFLQDIRAAFDMRAQRPPDYQLAVANREEVMRWLFPK